MSKDTTSQGFGLAVISLILLGLAFLVIFYFEKCIMGTIGAVVAATLATAAYLEARRARGPKQFVLTILVIAWLGAIFTVVWTASGSSRAKSIEVPVNNEVIIEDETEEEKEKRLKELEEKAEQLEEEDTLS